MARVKRGVKRRRRNIKWLKLAKGQSGRRRNCFRVAKLTALKGLEYTYRDRRLNKRNYRRLWITRINAATRTHGLSYSRFVAGLRKHAIGLDRKILADIAIHDPHTMAKIVEMAQA